MSLFQIRNPGGRGVFVEGDSAIQCTRVKNCIDAGDTSVTVAIDNATLTSVSEYCGDDNKEEYVNKMKNRPEELKSLLEAFVLLENDGAVKLIREVCATIVPTAAPKNLILPHTHPSVYNIRMGRRMRLCTKTCMTKKFFQEEKRVTDSTGTYRVWTSEISRVGRALLLGVDCSWIAPQKQVLYLGAATGRTCSYIADIVGPEGACFLVEFSKRMRNDQDKVDILSKAIEGVQQMVFVHKDARNPQWYERKIINNGGEVDVIISDLDQPDEIDIVARNALLLLKKDGHVMLFVQDRHIASKCARLAARGNMKEIRNAYINKGYVAITGKFKGKPVGKPVGKNVARGTKLRI